MKKKFTAIIAAMILVLSMVAMAGCGRAEAEKTEVTVLAAASLTDALGEIITEYEKDAAWIMTKKNIPGEIQTIPTSIYYAVSTGKDEQATWLVIIMVIFSFMMSYIGDVPVVGLPGCVMYSRTSVFDLIVPRLLAGERVTKKDINMLAHGGLCLNCEVCTYPFCGFGKA